jgi:hypothetical protein
LLKVTHPYIHAYQGINKANVYIRQINISLFSPVIPGGAVARFEETLD